MNKIKFNTTEIPFPSTWNEIPQTKKTLFDTEAGTDEEIIIRRNKLKVSASLKCTSGTAKTLLSFSQLNSFTLTQYDPRTDAAEERTVRMTDFSYGYVNKSWELTTTATTGLWNVSFTLEEF